MDPELLVILALSILMSGVILLMQLPVIGPRVPGIISPLGVKEIEASTRRTAS
jgi:hypothetical protein